MAAAAAGGIDQVAINPYLPDPIKNLRTRPMQETLSRREAQERSLRQQMWYYGNRLTGEAREFPLMRAIPEAIRCIEQANVERFVSWLQLMVMIKVFGTILFGSLKQQEPF
ncbi:hypothetical protein ACH5RR_030663 [Cinchona calisaya]|uniref:Uncharacterized protein n=1 Tax=Cinchona calisaya TaxID=153742 RepID=A0ABD2YZJ1_9GENT